MKRKFIFSTTLSLLLILVSCSKGGGGENNTFENKSVDTIETEMYGIYQAILSPLNASVAGESYGSLTLVRDMDDFVAHVRFSEGPASILHTQSIHIGNRCPTAADDLNKDGFIDAEEGAKVYGKTIVPLDEDLNSQWMGGGTYPLADEFGHYSYSQIASYTKFMKDLQEEDINPTDDLIKLDSQTNMMAIGKVVVIYGISPLEVLPETVQGRGRLNPHEALPIACGTIKKIKHVPGEIDNDQTGITPPDEEVPGGLGGLDDGADFSSSELPTEPGVDYGEDN